MRPGSGMLSSQRKQPGEISDAFRSVLQKDAEKKAAARAAEESKVTQQQAKTSQAVQDYTAAARDLMNRQVTAPTVAPIANVSAQNVQAANIRTPQEMEMLRQAVAQAQANTRQAGNVNVNEYLQALMASGGQSEQALQMAQAAAAGQGPSAAQAQLQSGIDQAIAAQLAAGQSAGGGAAALRGAQQQGAMLQQQAANQAAQLRAQEQAQAMQLYGSLAGQTDQLAAARAQAAGGLSLGAQELAGAQRQNAINAYLSGAGQAAGIGAELASQQAALQQQAGLANQQSALQAALANQQAGLSQQALNVQAQLDAQRLQQAYAGLGLGGLGQAAGFQQGMTGQQMDFLLGNRGLEAQMQQARWAKQAADTASQRELLGAGIGATGSILAEILSDERSKTSIKPNDATQEFLSALTDNQYKYKDPSKKGAAKGKQFGPMAQDLAKTEMGRTAVVEMEDGMMGVDPSRAVLLALAGLSNLNKRLDALEA